MYRKLPAFILILTVFCLMSLGVLMAVQWSQLHQVEKRLSELEKWSPNIVDSAELNVKNLDTRISNLENQIVPSGLSTISARVSAVDTSALKNSSIVSSPSSQFAPAREYVIFLGSGTTTNRDWTSLSSAAVTLDTRQYRNIRSVKFEAGLAILNGEAFARLYNSTTQTPYYISEVMHNTSAGEWRTSPSFSLPAGTHQLSVQLRSSSGEQASLIGARLKITAD